MSFAKGTLVGWMSGSWNHRGWDRFHWWPLRLGRESFCLKASTIGVGGPCPFWICLTAQFEWLIRLYRIRITAPYRVRTSCLMGSSSNSPQFEQVKAFSQDNNPVSVSISQVIVYKAPFTISSHAFRRQKWSNLARDSVLRLHKTPPLVSFLVCWLLVPCFPGGLRKEAGLFLRNKVYVQCNSRPCEGPTADEAHIEITY
jgi:hypothetical protein